MRDHQPFLLEEFNGYFNRGDVEVVPFDHAQEIENITFGESFIEVREEIVPTTNLGAGNNDIVRIHEYTMQTQRSHLILNSSGEIFHRLANGTLASASPILTIAAMTDFNVESFNGRAYITPFFTNASGQQVGLQNEFLYVYKGDGTTARKAAGAGPPASPAMIAANGAAGNTDPGIHLFAVVFETDTGFLTSPGAFVQFTTSANLSVSFSNIPVSPDPFVTARHIVATKVITSFNGDFLGYEYFFIPTATINDNVTTVLANQSFFDLDLVENASHLFDIFSEIPAGVGITSYHGRLVLTTTFADISVAYVSFAGEPEAIDQVDGLLIVPLDGKPLTNCKELRDVLYLFKLTLTVAYSDNGDVPSTWVPFTIDEGEGTSVHGIGTVLDSGGVNIDYLIVAALSGIRLFNGNYPEVPLTWKIDTYWLALDVTQFNEIEVVVDNIRKVIYITQPYTETTPNKVLIGDYENGLNPKRIRWSFLSFNMPCSTVDIVNINTGTTLGNVFVPLYGFRENLATQCGLYIPRVNRLAMRDVLRTNAGIESNNVIPLPIMITGYGMISKSENIVHCTGLKIRIKGIFGSGEGEPSSGPVDLYLLSLPGNFDSSVNGPIQQSSDEQYLGEINPSTIPTGREPQVLANFIQQRIAFRIECVPAIESEIRYFRLLRVILFHKELYSMFPA